MAVAIKIGVARNAVVENDVPEIRSVGSKGRGQQSGQQDCEAAEQSQPIGMRGPQCYWVSNEAERGIEHRLGGLYSGRRSAVNRFIRGYCRRAVLPRTIRLGSTTISFG